MNIYEQKMLWELFRKTGLPRDQFGNFLPVKDMIVWFELDRVLTREDQEWIANELRAMVKAECLMEQIRLGSR